jgi:hypothetical protein
VVLDAEAANSSVLDSMRSSDAAEGGSTAGIDFIDVFGIIKRYFAVRELTAPVMSATRTPRNRRPAFMSLLSGN